MRLLNLLMSFANFIGVIAFAIAEAVQLAQHGTDGLQQATLLNGLTYLIGVNGWVVGGGHMFFGKRVAQSIGWQASPFQWEVGLANVGIGLLGVMASGYGRNWWLATILAFSVFFLGAAVGHVREMITEKNFSPGNAGPIFWYDIIVPVAMIVLYITLD